ncbi:MAG: EAL domain-containing protein [Treponema sp.]|nr:EAL domain-containing protein [Treponema sp.]
MKEGPEQQKPTILLVEKNEEDRKLLTDIISSHYNIVYSQAEEEILLLLQDKEDVISAAVIDSESALPILETIRAIPTLEQFPVLISFSAPDENLEIKLLDLDIVDFLKKPFAPNRVYNRLKTAIKLFNANSAIYELERDELTGLYTRQAFLRKAEKIRAEHPTKRFCVMAFDFDNFKSSNTLYGEEKCNEFLAYTAKRLKGLLPRGIAGRFGGDQFILFFDYEGDVVDVERVKTISKAILDTAPIPHQIAKVGINAPISYDLPFIVCCDRAFLAIREIKGIYGKDIAFFESGLQKQLLDEQHIIETMEAALENNEFMVFYQPKHEAITEKIVGAEALVRWKHGEYGFMGPNQFIPIFEKNGFITKLDFFVLEQVCKDIKRWEKEGYPIVPISVNVSRRDFIEVGIIDKQLQLIESYQVPHEFLHMEVTESLYSDNTDIIVSQVRKVQNLGFEIEMDDFGAGYSSLGMLAGFPLDVIKLDISFVRDLERNEIVIENIIKMAHRLGLLTVAEGAETTDQFVTLKSLGCDYIQGYYFSKPLSVENYEAYLRSSSVEIIKPKKTRTGENDSWHMNESLLVAASEVAEAVPGGFFSYHADGNLEIISFNKELMNMFACETAEEFRTYTGNSFKGIVMAADFEYVQKSIENQIKEDNDLDYVEYRIKAKDGTVKYVKDYGRFVKTKKYGDIFYVFINDVTEEQRWYVHSEIENFKKMELEHVLTRATTANKAKDIFMSNVVKDISPLIKEIIESTNNIGSNLSNPEIICENLSKAKRAEEKVLSFVNNIGELSRIGSGEVHLEETPTDISHAVDNIYNLVKKVAVTKGVKLEYWSQIYNPYIYQDIIHTTDVVMNILMNAIKYTPPRGVVKFGLKQYPGKNENECMIDFICEDTGIGISEEFLPYVCNNYSREDNEVNAVIPGSGLGLAIAKELLGLMSGTIEIKSELGKGTTVRTSQPHRFADKKDVKKAALLVDHL